MADFFFLTNVEYVDFTRWSVDGQVDEAVRKLATALGLPAQPSCAEPAPELLVQAMPIEEKEAEDELEATSAPAFARGDLSELFITAAELAHQDPEQAIFLYRRVIEVDPEYMQGKAPDFVQREEKRLKPVWQARMLAQAEAAMKAGEWSRAERIGRDMLLLDRNNFEATSIVDVCVKNAECEPMYQHAVLAAQTSRWGAVATLMRDIKETCPDYGDPAGLILELFGFLRELATLKGHSSYVTSVAFSPDGSLLASASHDDTVILWEMPSGRELTILTGYSSMYSVAFSPDGSLLASASLDGTVKLWKMPGRRQLTTLTGHSGCVNSVAFSSDGSLLASGSDDDTIMLWEIPSGQELDILKGHSEAGSVAFSPDGSLLVSTSNDNTIKLWEMPGRRPLGMLTGHSDLVLSVAFSPDGSLLASASVDGTIKLRGMPGGHELATLKGHRGAVYSVTFSPDNSLLASASDDKTIKLWEMPGGHELATFKGHSGVVYSVAFSPDGWLLASASDDNTIKLWGPG